MKLVLTIIFGAAPVIGILLAVVMIMGLIFG